ncbi:MAG: hydrogen peroxide-inducible genes activator [Hyphomicrobiales bacterium]|nr:MAG: hydrogen peroxide-inducible genes activator [Hyphomicrobiales bacterium]
MAQPTLRQLQYVVALADAGHFGRAAEQSHVTQPALSQQVRLLEDMCGAPLFDRLGRTVRLTPFGREFTDRARKILDEADRLMSFVESHSGQPNRPLRFGLIPTVAPYLLPDIFPALREDLPGIAFTVSENRTDALLDGLREGTLDLALIASQPPPGGPRLSLDPLFRDGFVLATDLAEEAAGPVALDAIDGDRMLLLDEGHCFRDQAIAACGLDGTAGKTFAATSLSTIVEFVASGQGITLLPEIALRKEASGRIQVHRLAAPGAGRMLSLCWRQGSPFEAVYGDMAASIRRTRNGTS